MKRFLSLLSVVVFGAMLFSCARDIVDFTGSLSGTIKDYNTGQLISNCRVSLSPSGQSQTSSAEGTFRFSDLEPGDYSLTFVKSGYSDETATATIVAGKDVTVSVLMKAKSVFSISETVLDFGDSESTKTVYLQNNSDERVSFKISNIPQWASFDRTEGSVGNGSSEVLTINVDRNAINFGEFSQVVTFNYSGKTSGSISLTLRLKKVELTAPTVSTAVSAENVTQTSFDIKGNIIKTGGARITKYGHCWSTANNPTINDSKTDLGSTDAAGSYTSSVSGLAVNTIYYVRAYATNAYGTSYGEQVAVTTQDVSKNVWDGNIASSFAGGSGTMGDPYLIETGGQLLLAKEFNNKYFKLIGNIDLNKHNWLPYSFGGTIDGNGHQISNLYIKREGNGVGLFSQLGGTIKNVRISGIQVDCSNSDRVGAVAGSIVYGGKIVDCEVFFLNDSFVKGRSDVGGIVGNGEGDYTIKACKVTSSSTNVIITGNSFVGGVIGRNGTMSVESCHVSGLSVSGGDSVGGISGHTAGNREVFQECSFHGAIYGNYNVGGIVGSSYNTGFDLLACKAEIDLTAKDKAWGLSNGREYACYTVGTIKSDNTNVSQVFGLSNGAVLSYSAISCNLKNYKPGGTGTCTSVDITDNIAQFLKECYDAKYAKYWNFENTWTWKGVVDGKETNVICPRLMWEK